MKRSFILLTLLAASIYHVLAEDSIPVKNLDDLIVKGERQWISNGTINVIPSRKEKNLSNSPVSLIKAMHLPFVKEQDGVLQSISGEAVQIFINGEKADDIDLSTFWPKDVKLVQYMEEPDDPLYDGAKVAINFKTARYETGGITRINLFQRIPNNGFYTASSKLTYKKMTFGAMLWGDYLRDHRSSEKGVTAYRDIYYENEFYNKISREEETASYNRDESIRFAFNARYSSAKARITHTFSLGWNRNPGSGTHSSDIWTHNLFGSGSASTETRAKTLTPQIRGNYFFRFSDRVSMSALAEYSFARNSSFASCVFGDTKPVENNVSEDVNTVRVYVSPYFALSKKWSLQFKANAVANWYSSIYSGSTAAKMRQARQDLTASLRLYWKALQTLSLSLEPGIVTSLWRIGDVHEHAVDPTVSASANWYPSNRYSLSGTLRFFMRPPSASESNPVLTRDSELQWTLGNPHLKGLKSWDLYVASNYLPFGWLTLFFGVGYVKTYDEIITSYAPAPIEYGGIIQKMTNGNPSDRIRLNLNLQGSFFNDNLTIALNPEWHYTYYGGTTKRHFNQFSCSGDIGYTIGNCNFGVSYEAPYEDIFSGGFEKTWKQGTWNATFTYGNSDIYIEVRAENIFNNKSRSWKKYNSFNLMQTYNYQETGRCFSLNLTYTFGYGKRTDRNIDIEGPETVTTSIRRITK